MNIPLLSPLLSQVNGFVRVTLVMVALTLFFPALSASNGPLRLDVVTIAGILLVFFLHNATLSREKVVEGARNWHLHLFMQSCTLILLPLIGAATLFACKPSIPAELLLGVFYLCTLPSMVSSLVVVTIMTKGNILAVIFNATISGLVGMIATPLLMSFMIQTSGVGLSVGKALLGIAKQLLLPFVLGQLLRPVLGDSINKRRAIISKVDRTAILLAVSSSLTGSTHVRVWSEYLWGTIVAAAIMNDALLFIVLDATTWPSRRTGSNLADGVTAMLCGSKRSLASGIPMGKILFANNFALDLIVLPLMIYHQLQLIAYSTLARRYTDHMTHAENSPATPVNHVT